jgi:hypothetical protein
VKQRIILIGQSPLSFFLARELDQKIGNLVQTEIVWLTKADSVVHLPSIAGLLNQRGLGLAVGRLSDVKVDHHGVQSINLADRRVITSRSILDFDYLLLDQTPTYTAAELAVIAAQLVTLLSGLQAGSTLKKNQRARIYCQGQMAEAWQLALLVQSDLRRHYPRLVGAVEVLIDRPSGRVGEFLRHEELKTATASRLQLPGLTVQAPTSPLANRKIRGLRLDDAGHALIDQFSSPLAHPNVFIFDRPERYQMNLLRVLRSQARAIADELVAQCEGRHRRHFDWHSPALLLRGSSRYYLSLGHLENDRTRARLVAGLDRRLRRQLA